jgi:hypothetical protein
MDIPTTLDTLLGGLTDATGVPWSRDPQTIRAHIAQTGACLTVDPPDCEARTMRGLQLAVRVRLILPQSAGLPPLDHALRTLPALLTALGARSWVWDTTAQVGPQMYPGFTIDHTLGVCDGTD